MDIRHVVVLMLENRSFDSMLGALYQSNERFDGLKGTETNIWHKPDGSTEVIPVWKSPDMTPAAARVPDPDPGESFADIDMQINGLNSAGPPMGGFVDNYMRQERTADEPPADPAAVMHYFTPDQVPAISQLARAFGVSDRWHASAPCQTWPNRFFAHTATAAGYVNNVPPHFPYMMETVFNRLDTVNQPWRIYFHDIPHASTLARLWLDPMTNFRYYATDFANDAAQGRLPAYSFIEPQYFTDPIDGSMPNDQHPPHDVSHGEALIASVYNAVRSGPGWKHTLLVITYDEHGGCFDHVPPPAAVPPDSQRPDGFAFDRFGVRVPAVIVSPWIRPGSVVRPAGSVPFDHTSISATLAKLFGFAPLTRRDAAAPNLLDALTGDGSNDGPSSISVDETSSSPAQIAASAALPPNGMQHALNTAAARLPAARANIGAHVAALRQMPAAKPISVIDAVKSFLGIT